VILVHKVKVLEVLDGLMLGDGNLRLDHINARFRIGKSGEEYMDYLRHISEILQEAGVNVSPGYPKVSQKLDARGNRYAYCFLTTLSSPPLTYHFWRWYMPNTYTRKFNKVIPWDLKLSPISIAYWFMDDGSTSWSKGPNNRVNLTLASDSFTRFENDRLQEHLKRVGITLGVQSNSIGGWHLASMNISRINEFLDIVEPYILPCYRYKVKRPWYLSSLVGGE